MTSPRRQAVASGHVAAHVDQMQPAAGTQDTENLGGRSAFRVVVQMVQHHRRQHGRIRRRREAVARSRVRNESRRAELPFAELG
jgi:hypothetical protein